MLNRLAIFALAFSIFSMQTYSQVDKAQQRSESQQPSPTAPKVAVKQDSSPQLQTEHREHVDADVGVVPPLTKERYEKAAFWINVILAGVGIIGVGIGICTLLFLKSQTAHIKRQADQMEAQLKEMQKVSDIENKTLILQYRPRILIRNIVAKHFVTEFGVDSKCFLSFQIVNTGGSPAHIIGGAMHLLSVVAADAEPIQFIEGSEGEFKKRTLQPGERENFEDMLSTNTVIDAGWMKFHQGEETNRSVYLSGTIWYRDDLNIPRQTGLSRKYDPNAKRFVAQKDNEEEYSD